MNNLYNEKIEGLISAALADGVLTEKEKQVLFKKAQAEGIDLDEFEMVLDARLVELKKEEKAKTTASAPKSNKYGDIRKCPACGAIVPSLSGICPECGYEFSGIGAISSAQKLAELLRNTDYAIPEVKDISPEGKSDIAYALLQEQQDSKIRRAKEAYNDKRRQIIETFSIPNTKADLFEFLLTLKPRIRDIKDPLSKAYFKKYEECIEKAKIFFPEDPNISPFINSFDNEKKIIKRKRFFHSGGFSTIIVFGLLGIMILLCYLGIKNGW